MAPTSTAMKRIPHSTQYMCDVSIGPRESFKISLAISIVSGSFKFGLGVFIITASQKGTLQITCELARHHLDMATRPFIPSGPPPGCVKSRTIHGKFTYPIPIYVHRI